jgi:hypothetical protein
LSQVCVNNEGFFKINRMQKNLVFFLGGADAEMVRIAEVLASVGAEVVTKNLGWGANVSSYATEIAQAIAEGKTPVLLELGGIVLVDHHGDRSAEPASILQVLTLLGIQPTRLDLLIAANDSGFIPAMLAMGATPEEVAKIRLADRNAQGIIPEMEVEAERAISEAKTSGRLTVVQMAHSKSATVTDRLHEGAGGPGYDQLLIVSGDGEKNFFGDGKLCADLKEKFEGWNGGSGLGTEGGSAFWGGYPDATEVEDFILEQLG